ncbi:MAG: hypothetical protein ACRDI3_03615 [Actinomycetota bacterium]
MTGQGWVSPPPPPPPPPSPPRGTPHRSRLPLLLASIAVAAAGGLAIQLIASEDDPTPGGVASLEPSASPEPIASRTPLPGESPSVFRTEPNIFDFDNAAFLSGCGPTKRPRNHVGPLDLSPLDENVAAIARGVAALRGLDFTRVPRLRLVSPAGLEAKTTELYSRELSADLVEDTEHVLKLLRLMDPGADLGSLVKKAVTTEIQAFYLPKNETIFAPATARNDLSALEEVLLAHELEHALADQVLKLPIDDKVDATASDKELATRALIEGDASLLMQHYAITVLSPADRNSFLEDAAGLLADTDELPYILERSIAFPYHEGLLWVCYLYKKGGWTAVDKAYRRPPLSTAQILFPARYEDNTKPLNPRDPPTPPGWEKRSTQSFGAADLLMMLEAPQGFLSTQRPGESVGDVIRWGGGELHVWKRDDSYALMISLIDDESLTNPMHGFTLCQELHDWIGMTYYRGTPLVTRTSSLEAHRYRGRLVLLSCEDDGVRNAVRLTIVPDHQTARALLGKHASALPRRLRAAQDD